MIRNNLFSNSKPVCVILSQPEMEVKSSYWIQKAVLKGIDFKVEYSIEKENNAGKIEKKYARQS